MPRPTPQEQFDACPELMQLYIRGLEYTVKTITNHDGKLQEAIIAAHGRALPENWVYQGPLESIDLLVAEILTAREERKVAEASEAQLARMAGEYERRFMAILGPELLKRREEQDAKHDGPAHDDCHTRLDWTRFIHNWNNKATIWSLEASDAEHFESRMFDVAGLAIAAIQSTRRKRRPVQGHPTESCKCANPWADLTTGVCDCVEPLRGGSTYCHCHSRIPEEL